MKAETNLGDMAIFFLFSLSLLCKSLSLSLLKWNVEPNNREERKQSKAKREKKKSREPVLLAVVLESVEEWSSALPQFGSFYRLSYYTNAVYTYPNFLFNVKYLVYFLFFSFLPWLGLLLTQQPNILTLTKALRTYYSLVISSLTPNLN